MKLRFLPLLQSELVPDSYGISGSVITASKGGKTESFDLSGVDGNNLFQQVEPDTLSLLPHHIIKDVEYRDGELYVTLWQSTPTSDGFWIPTGWISASEYDPNEKYIKQVPKEEYRQWAR